MSAFKHRFVVFGCLLLTGFCFWKAAPGLLGDQNSSAVQSAQASANSLNTKKCGITTPIQDIRPGMRIVGHNPKREEVESTIDPTPGYWRLLSVRMEKSDGGYFEAQLLRPLSWISRHKAKPGRTIQINMPEMHVVGAAEVISISDCPPIDPGNDPVVISTFKNVSNIYIEGESKPIGVTAGHPIWSEDRQEFVHSEKLQVGEKLRSALGHTVRITSIEPRAGPEAVYNLEVAGEHVYCVADSGLLVHNSAPCGNLPNQVRALKELGVDKSGRRAFLKGEEVVFNFSSKGGDPVEGFLQIHDGKLTSQLFAIKNLDTKEALKSFMRFEIDL